MPLRANMARQDIIDYLLNDLRQSVINDVQPCVQSHRPQGGYFVVPRLVLSYVDYLGCLYHGFTGRINRRTGRRVFADSRYAKDFLRDILALVDQNYATYSELLWEIYRNGTVHLYQPLKFTNQGKLITWHAYKGSRTKLLPRHVPGITNLYNATHLIPAHIVTTPNVGELWYQPLSITCLYDDLLTAIGEYANLIKVNQDAVNKFRQTADALDVPEPTQLVWW